MLKKILHQISEISRAVARFFMRPFRLILMVWQLFKWLVGTLFGKLSYQWPIWITMIIRIVKGTAKYVFNFTKLWIASNPKRAKQVGAGLAVVVLLGSGAYWWYQQQPKPIEASFTISNPERTRIEDPKALPDPVTVVFSHSIAPIDRIGKEVGSGVDISPKVEGTWRWVDDNRLRFTPRADWPVGAKYDVSFEKELIAEHIALNEYHGRFQTANFSANISDVQFYQDPVDPSAKKVVATVTFTHPVDTADFEKHIKLKQEGKSSGFFGIGAEESKFHVSYDKLRLNAYIHSEPLPIPPKDLRLDLTLDSGVRAAQGGKPTADASTRAINIPGLYSLKVRDLNLSQVENDQMEPDRVLIVNFTSDVSEKESLEKVQAWLLPVYHPETPEIDRKNPFQWYDTSRIGADILKQSEQLKLESIAAERDSSETHSFKYKADAGRYVYIKVDKGVKAQGGYLLEKTVDRSIRVQPFPRQLRVMASGSLLAMSGDKKIPVLARDVEAMQVEIGRLLPQQLQHLVSMSYGAYSRPDFSYSFNESNLTERFAEVVEFPNGVEGRPQYSAVDFSKYLSADGGRRGIFFLKVQSYDVKNKRPTGTQDKRLIVVTDLGMLVKKNVDGSQGKSVV